MTPARRTRTLFFVSCGSILRWVGYLLCTLACVLAWLWVYGSAEVISLGGTRDIVVEVDDVPDGFSVVVAMIPVSCFDAATNERLNRSKARLHGLAGLGKSLDISPELLGVYRGIAGFELEVLQPLNDRYRARFFVPECRIESEASDSTDSIDAPAFPAGGRSQLFTCVDDHAATIEDLKVIYCERLSEFDEIAVESLSSLSVSNQPESADERLSSLEREADLAFSAAEQEYLADLRVLAFEKASLGKRLVAARAGFELGLEDARERVMGSASRTQKALRH